MLQFVANIFAIEALGLLAKKYTTPKMPALEGVDLDPKGLGHIHRQSYVSISARVQEAKCQSQPAGPKTRIGKPAAKSSSTCGRGWEQRGTVERKPHRLSIPPTGSNIGSFSPACEAASSASSSVPPEPTIPGRRPTRRPTCRLATRADSGSCGWLSSMPHSSGGASSSAVASFEIVRLPRDNFTRFRGVQPLPLSAFAASAWIFAV